MSCRQQHRRPAVSDNIIDLQARRAAKDAARDSEAPDATADTAPLSDEQRAALIAEIAERLRLLGPGWRISYAD
jgi:hypothetical protein